MDGGWSSWPMLAIGVGVVVLSGVLIALGVRLLDAAGRRETQGAALQQRIAEPLTRDPALAGASILPVVHVRRRQPTVIELTGQVPTEAARDTALRVAERAAARHCRRFHIVDRLEVVSAQGDDSARRSA